MKKVIALFMSILLIFSLAACGSQNGGNRSQTSQPTESTTSESAPETSQQPSETPTEAPAESSAATQEAEGESSTEDTAPTGSNILIAYFSVPEDVDTDGVDAVAGASVVVKDGEKLGNTEYVARLIQETIGGDLFRIETVEPYPLDHEPLVDQAADEQDAGLRPELATHGENFEKYEYVFLGFPIWWSDMPQPLYTFLEEYDFGAKTIIPFVTHGGSGSSHTVDTISQLQPGALMMGNELVLSRNDVAESEETVVTWVKELEIRD